MSKTGRTKLLRYGFEANIRWLTRQRDSLLKKLAGSEPFVDGSIVKVSRRCGNKNCRCVRGEKHESWYLMYKVKGVTRAVYIPRELEDEVRKLSRSYRELKDLIGKLCRIQKAIIRRHVTERRLKRGRP